MSSTFTVREEGGRAGKAPEILSCDLKLLCVTVTGSPKCQLAEMTNIEKSQMRKRERKYNVTNLQDFNRQKKEEEKMKSRKPYCRHHKSFFHTARCPISRRLRLPALRAPPSPSTTLSLSLSLTPPHLHHLPPPRSLCCTRCSRRVHVHRMTSLWLQVRLDSFVCF